MREPVRDLRSASTIGLMLKSYEIWWCRRGYLASLVVSGSPRHSGGDAPGFMGLPCYCCVVVFAESVYARWQHWDELAQDWGRGGEGHTLKYINRHLGYHVTM